MWLLNSIKESKKLRTHYKLHDIDIYIKDRLPEHIDPNFVFLYVAKQIPSHLLRNIDIIYVGEFDNIKKKKANAVFENGAIFVSNEQDSDIDMIDDLIHEIAHSNEEQYEDVVYADGQLEKEYSWKRKALFRLLNDAKGYKIPVSYVLDFSYSEEIEDILYDEVGYTTLNSLINGIFTSTYSAVSIREYFARGFEEYFLGDKKKLKELCPILYSKIEQLYNLEDS